MAWKAACSTAEGDPAKVTTERLWSWSRLKSRTATPETARMAATICSTTSGRRPSLKLGTHSTRDSKEMDSAERVNSGKRKAESQESVDTTGGIIAWGDGGFKPRLCQPEDGRLCWMHAANELRGYYILPPLTASAAVQLACSSCVEGIRFRISVEESQSMGQVPTKNVRSFLAWVWAGVLVAVGGAVLAGSTGLLPAGPEGSVLLVAAGGMALLSIPFLARWLVHRDERWAIVTAWVFLGLAILLGVVYLQPPAGQVIAIVALGEIAAPFAVAYFTDRRQWWALIVAYGLLILGILVALTLLGVTLEILGALALVTIALPFWVVYLTNRAEWWALIPAGIIGTMGVVLLVLFSLTQTVSGTYIAYRQVRSGRRGATVSQAASQSVSPPPPVTPPPAQAPVPAPPSPAVSAPGMSPQNADAAATARAQAQAEGQMPVERKPLVEFRPLDPFKDRKADEEE